MRGLRVDSAQEKFFAIFASYIYKQKPREEKADTVGGGARQLDQNLVKREGCCPSPDSFLLERCLVAIAALTAFLAGGEGLGFAAFRARALEEQRAEFVVLVHE